MDKSSSLVMPMSSQDISNKYKNQILGMPWASPSSSTKISGHFSRHYIFIASYTMCCSQSVNYFCFQFSLVLLAVVYGWIPAYFFGERHTPFSLLRTLQFHSYYSASVLFLLELPLVFVLFRTFQLFFVVRCVQLSGL